MGDLGFRKALYLGLLCFLFFSPLITRGDVLEAAEWWPPSPNEPLFGEYLVVLEDTTTGGWPSTYGELIARGESEVGQKPRRPPPPPPLPSGPDKPRFVQPLDVPTEFENQRWRQYDEFLDSLRSRLSTERSRGIHVLPEQTQAGMRPTDWFDVRLSTMADDGDNSITVFFRFRADNLYLHGFRTECESQWWEIRHVGTDNTPQQLIPGSNALGFSYNYNDFGGANIVTVNLGPARLRDSILTLASRSSSSQEQGRSLLVVAIMIAEASRFTPIQEHMTRDLYGSVQLTSYLLGLITSWSDLSRRVLTPTEPVEGPNFFHSDDVVVPTFAAAIKILALVLLSCRPTQPPKGLPPVATVLQKQDYCPVGQELLEVFSIVINKIDGATNVWLYGSVTVVDGLGTQHIYSRDRDHSEYLSLGNDASLTGPTRAISALGTIHIRLDLSDYYHADFSKGAVHWDPYSISNKYDQRLHQVVTGRSGYATVNYVVYSNAVRANIEVRLTKGQDNADSDQVYGKIVVGTDVGVESVLFDKKSSDYAEVPHGSLIPLTRSVVAVPLPSYVQVRALLYDYDKSSADDEIANGGVCLLAKPSGTSEASITGIYDAVIRVKVTWHAWPTT